MKSLEPIPGVVVACKPVFHLRKFDRQPSIKRLQAHCESSGRAPPSPARWLSGQPVFCGRAQGATMVYDVCVIGSGPAGGGLSKQPAEAGAKVALVEAGRMMTGQDFP